MRLTFALLLALTLASCTAGEDGVDASVEFPACAKPRVHADHDWRTFFDSDSAALRPRGKVILGELAALWQQNGGSVVELTGHTDAVEAATARQSLSLERAETVKTYLAEQGIPVGRITTENSGPGKPFVQGVQDEPHNRRVDVVPRIYASRDEQVERMVCKIWVGDHCFTPSRLAKAGAKMCSAVMSTF